MQGPSNNKYVHPVVGALSTLDRSHENYGERRVKLINKYTHTIDPVIEVVRAFGGAAFFCVVRLGFAGLFGVRVSERSSRCFLSFLFFFPFFFSFSHVVDDRTRRMRWIVMKNKRKRPCYLNWVCVDDFCCLFFARAHHRASPGHAPASKLGNDVEGLLKQLAEVKGVLKGAPTRVEPMVLTDDERALITAVTKGDAVEVQRLLAAPGRRTLELPDGDTLLHLACRNPVDKIIAQIARTKPDLNAVNLKGKAPLHELALNGGSLVILGSLVKVTIRLVFILSLLVCEKMMP